MAEDTQQLINGNGKEEEMEVYWNTSASVQGFLEIHKEQKKGNKQESGRTFIFIHTTILIKWPMVRTGQGRQDVIIMCVCGVVEG